MGYTIYFPKNLAIYNFTASTIIGLIIVVLIIGIIVVVMMELLIMEDIIILANYVQMQINGKLRIVLVK